MMTSSYALGVMESSVYFITIKIFLRIPIEVPDADHPWTRTEFMDILAKTEANNG